MPLHEEQARMLDRQFLELFLEESPEQRSPLYSTLTEAIATFDLNFADDEVADAQVKLASA